MDRRSLRTMMSASLAALAVTIVIVSATAISSLQTLGNAIETILRENYRSVIACEEMNEALERQDSAAQFASAGRDDIARSMLVTHRAAFEHAFDVEAHNITLPGEGAAVQTIDQRYRSYVADVDRTLALPSVSERSEAYFHDLLPHFTAIKNEIQRVLRMNQSNMLEADARARELAHRRVMLTLAVCAVALLFALAFAWRLPGIIVRPVAMLSDAARSVGRGDLDVAIPELEVRELTPLAVAFRKMVSQLKAYRESSLGELLAAKDLANATVQCLLDPVIVLGRNDDILLTNDAAESAFGLRVGSAEEIRSQPFTIPADFILARDSTLASGKPVAPRSLSDAMRWIDQSGTERFFLVRTAPLLGESKQGRGVIVVAQDVTRLRRIDELKSDMVATVSHEFKTPLTSLRMATHLLLEPGTGPLTSDQSEIVTTARDDTERLRALVDELLDLVRIETEAGDLHRVPLDVRGLLQTAADAQRSIARQKPVTLAIEPSAAPINANVDPAKLGIVLANLISNAIRHTPAGGEVVLSAGEDANGIRLMVRDTGEGMSPDESSRLFERGAAARSATRPNGRHGLGLTIAHEIVLQHGGELKVQSAVGRGTQLTVVLPRDVS